MTTVPAGADHGHLKAAALSSVPVVMACRPPVGMDADCVLVDAFGVRERPTRRLIAKGHRRIALVANPPAVYTGAERFRGFCVASMRPGSHWKTATCGARSKRSNQPRPPPGNPSPARTAHGNIRCQQPATPWERSAPSIAATGTPPFADSTTSNSRTCSACRSRPSPGLAPHHEDDQDSRPCRPPPNVSKDIPALRPRAD
jgi:hypothetical protein